MTTNPSDFDRLLDLRPKILEIYNIHYIDKHEGKKGKFATICDACNAPIRQNEPFAVVEIMLLNIDKHWGLTICKHCQDRSGYEILRGILENANIHGETQTQTEFEKELIKNMSENKLNAAKSSDNVPSRQVPQP